jgi:predicted nucleic acid-binding protein
MPEQLVVDCSVAAKWILPEPGREAAVRLLKRSEAGEVVLLAPDLLLAEFASLLAKRSRRKELSERQAEQAFELMQRCAPRLSDTRPRVRRALSLALQTQLSFWDCVYINLAIEQGCAVVTADQRLFRGASARHAALRFLQ